MKYFVVFLPVFMLLEACSSSVSQEKFEYESVAIQVYIGEDLQQEGRGVMIDPNTLLTSAHVLLDDRAQYRIDAKSAQVVWRDIPQDQALLQFHTGQTLPEIPFVQAHTGETVSMQVLREGKKTSYTGTILAVGFSLKGYENNGKSVLLENIVHTDLPIISGDSGAPIFSSTGALIDIVHIVANLTSLLALLYLHHN